MRSRLDSLDVFVNDEKVGVLDRDPDGYFNFYYDGDAHSDQVVSLSMRRGVDHTEYAIVPPPFQVSLPEGAVLERLRSMYRKEFNMDDPFDLLRLMGRSGIGRVTYGGKRISDTRGLDEILVRDARSSDAAKRLWRSVDHFGSDILGISGAMPKVLTRSTVAHGGSADMILGGHIIKFDDDMHFGASVMEYVCMSACRGIGMDVAEVELSPACDTLLIKRFDIMDNGRYRGFEDACALSGYPPSRKYMGSIEDVFDVARSFFSDVRLSSAISDITRMVLVNDILRNGDAHMKNYAVTYDNPDDPYWSPMYDVLSTSLFYPDESPALAWDVEHEVDRVWLDDHRAMEVLCRLTGRSEDSLISEYRELAVGLRWEINRCVESLESVHMSHDMRRFVNGLSEYFDGLFSHNSLTSGIYASSSHGGPCT